MFTYSSKEIYRVSFKSLHLSEQTETNAEMNKADCEQSLASERSMGKLFKYSKAFHKSSLPSILKYKIETTDTDHLKAELLLTFFVQASLSHSIYQIFSKTIQTRRFPDYWKVAIISPIHKKDNKSDIEIYRPVSLLCIVSKMIERIIFRRLYEHLSPMFHSSQHGFRKNKSTVLQLLTFLQIA